MDNSHGQLDAVLDRLQRIETALSTLLEQRTVKERYATAEVAEILGKSDYTVREWCRKGQIPAEKTANGRGWIVSHETLIRLRNRELPLPEYTLLAPSTTRRPGPSAN
jgi:excisionase family DNA binding protein